MLFFGEGNKEMLDNLNNVHKNNLTHINKKPIFCYDHCTKCLSEVKYSTNDVMLKNQKDVLNELAAHGHKKKIKMAKLRRNRNLAEARLELIDHIKKYHN